MKRKILLRTALLATTLMLFGSVGWGQAIFEENFDYPIGDLPTTNWNTANSGNTVVIMENSLSYLNYASSNIGNKANMYQGLDYNRSIGTINSGSVYAAALVYVTSATATGDYCLHFTQSGTTYKGRFWIKTSGTGVAFGIAKSGTTPAVNYSSEYALEQTHLIVMKYTFNSGSSTDDIVELFVNPVVGEPEPTATVTASDNTTTDATSITLFGLRQATTNAPNFYLDGIRVATTWADAVKSSIIPSDPTIITTPNNISKLSYSLDNGPSPSQSFKLTGSNLNGTDVTVTAPTSFEVSLNDAAFSSSVTLTAFDGTETTVYTRLVADLAVNDYSGDITIAGGGDADGATVAVSGKVVEAFGIPYSNLFSTQEEIDLAINQGLNLNSLEWGGTAGGGYTKISNGGYIETPSINFSSYSDLLVKFDATTFGGVTGQVLSVKISEDGGSFVTLNSYVLTDVYRTFTTFIDTDIYSSTDGVIRIEMTNGTNTSRFRDFSIEEVSYSTWNGVGNWDVTTNWTPAGVPATSAWVIVNSGTLTINDNVTVEGVIVNPGAAVTIEAEKTLTASRLILKSQSDKKVASFINNGVLAVSSVEYNRYVPVGAFEYISTPISGQKTGVFGPLGATSAAGNGLFTFNVTNDDWTSPITVGNTLINTMQGFAFIANSNQTVTFSGTGFYSGNQTIQLSKAANGFNLVGNPYPSAIDWDLETAWTRVDVSPNIWINFANEPTEANFATYNWDTDVQTNWVANIGTDLGIIAPTQAFWVENISETPPPSLVDLTVMPTAQVHSANVVNKKSTSENPLIRLQAQRSGYSDEMVIYFHSEATEGMDRFDTRKKLGSGAYPQLYAPVADAIAAVNTLPQSLLSEKVTVPIILKSDMAGSITIALTELKNLGDDMNIILTDKATGSQTDLRTSAYTVEVEAGSTLTNRLEVTIERKNVTSAPAIDKLTVNIYASAKSIYVGMAQQGSSVEVYNAIGVQMLSQKLNGGAVESIQTNLPKGVYIVVVNGKEGRTVKRVFIQ